MQTKNTEKMIYKHLLIRDFRDIIYKKIVDLGLIVIFFLKKIHVIIS